MEASDILYLFYRLGEPVYYPKGSKDNTVIFNVNADFLDEAYASNATAILNRFGSVKGRRIDLTQYLTPALKKKIDAENLTNVDRSQMFSVFIPKHAKTAGRLIELLMYASSIEELITIAAYTRDRVNPQLFAYALSTALMHRDDTKHLNIPNYAEMFPGSFIEPGIMSSARQRLNVLDGGVATPIEIPLDFTGTDADPEHKVAYWREDIGINLHHWHWHLVYPFEGPLKIVDKNRRGELFFFMHRQIMARYNVERLCNEMNLAERFVNWDEPIPEAYFSKLLSTIAGRNWPARPAGVKLKDLRRYDQDMIFDIDDMYRYKNRIFDAINRQRIYNDKNEEIRLDNEQGIDVLGNAVEGNIISPNKLFYGDLHNCGHMSIGFIHDPENNYLEGPSVMLSQATAMRDPMFYRWHAFVDSIFQEHKKMLTPYTVKELTFSDIAVTEATVVSVERSNRPASPRNNFFTFFMLSDIDLTRGMDFTPRGSVLARLTHLNHDDFEFIIKVNNTTGAEQKGTIRIFIAPVLTYGNYALTLDKQRNLMIEMDKFAADLPAGQSVIKRRSTESAITIPFSQTFRDLDERPAGVDAQDKFNYCGCGWPQHMLVPKGKEKGYDCVLFVMITNYKEDQAVNDASAESACRTGISFCGLRDQPYPDRKPMNFPFDRQIRSGVEYLGQFLTPNMAMTHVRIFHVSERRLGQHVPLPAIPIGQIDKTENPSSTEPGPAATTETSTQAKRETRETTSVTFSLPRAKL